MAVFFHSNFGLNRHHMSGVVERLLKEPSLGDKELGQGFGYGAPFATRYRYWLHKTGLADLRRPFRLTEFGRVVRDRDPEFDTTLTKWFMHHELTIDPERAETWHFFMNDFRLQNKRFNKQSLFDALMMKLRHHHEQHFGPNSSMLPVIVRKLIECYTKNEALGALGLLRTIEKGEFEFVTIQPLGPWTTPTSLDRAFLG